MTSSMTRLTDGALRELAAAVPLGVLGGDHHRADPTGRSSSYSTETWDLPSGRSHSIRGCPLKSLSHRGEPLGDPVGQHDRQRHPLPGFVGGVAEHHALVAGALLLLRAAVHAHGDVGRLPVDRGQHRAGPAVEAVTSVGVPDGLDRLADEVGDVHVGVGGDLAGHDRHAGRDQRFARHPARRIVGEDRVEHGVGDLVGDLVGMAFGDGLGGEDVTLGTGHLGRSGFMGTMRRGAVGHVRPRCPAIYCGLAN